MGNQNHETDRVDECLQSEEIDTGDAELNNDGGESAKPWDYRPAQLAPESAGDLTPLVNHFHDVTIVAKDIMGDSDRHQNCSPDEPAADIQSMKEFPDSPTAHKTNLIDDKQYLK